eukprot:6206581-Pleurochrysis_carterae.AAC.1
MRLGSAEWATRYRKLGEQPLDDEAIDAVLAAVEDKTMREYFEPASTSQVEPASPRSERAAHIEILRLLRKSPPSVQRDENSLEALRRRQAFFNPPHSGTSRADVQADLLEQWLRTFLRDGAHAPLELRHFEATGRGLACAKAAHAGETVLRIPRRLLLSADCVLGDAALARVVRNAWRQSSVGGGDGQGQRNGQRHGHGEGDAADHGKGGGGGDDDGDGGERASGGGDDGDGAEGAASGGERRGGELGGADDVDGGCDGCGDGGGGGVDGDNDGDGDGDDNDDGDNDDLHEDIVLALALLLEPQLRPDGAWAAYHALLPQRPPSAILWDEEMIGRLNGTPLPEEVRAVRNALKKAHKRLFPRLSEACPRLFPEKKFTLDRFMWAYAIVESRGL